MTEDDEFELLHLERERAKTKPVAVSPDTHSGNPIFRSASTVEGSGVKANAARGLLGVMDILNTPTAAAAKLRGQNMGDANPYFWKPEVEKLKLDTTGEGERESDYQRMRLDAMKKSGTAFPDFNWQASPSAVNFWTETAGQTASDPLFWVGPLTKMLKGGTKVADVAAGKLAEEASGVHQGALRKAGTEAGRNTLEAAAGKEKEIGDEFLNYLDNAEEYMSKKPQVESVLKELPPISVESAIQTLLSKKSPAVAGRSFDWQDAANNLINKDVKALRGGELPPDLSVIAKDAGKKLQRSDIEVGLANKAASAEEKGLSQAERIQKAAQKDARQAGDRVATQRKYETDFGWWHEEALQESKNAAAKAREAAENVRAQVAVGSMSQADLAAAQAKQEAAGRSYMVAYSANRLYAGDDIKTVAQRLAKEGMGADDITSVLTDARRKAEEVPTLPNQVVSALDYRNLRKNLDYKTDFATEGSGVANKARLAARTTMKDELLQKAKEHGPEYEKWMAEWSDDLDKLERIKKLVGTTEASRDSRIESFIANLFGKNTKYKQQLMADLDNIFGSDIVGKAKETALASSLGPEGKAGFLPKQFTGRSLLAQTIAGALAAPAAGLPFSSPLVASRVTLPVTRGVADAASFVSDKLTPEIREWIRQAAVARAVGATGSGQE